MRSLFELGIVTSMDETALVFSRPNAFSLDSRSSVIFFLSALAFWPRAGLSSCGTSLIAFKMSVNNPFLPIYFILKFSSSSPVLAALISFNASSSILLSFFSMQINP